MISNTVGWALVLGFFSIALRSCNQDGGATATTPQTLGAATTSEQAELNAARKPNTTLPQWVWKNTRRPNDALVFVHGIFGDTLDTWKNAKTGKHFYDLISADPRLGSHFDIFAYGYPSNMLQAGSSTIQEAANRLINDLQYYGIDQYKKVVFVAHSMGGLVVLRALLTKRDLLPSVPLVILFATPQEGAQITELARHVLNNPGLAEMLPADSNSYLQNLNDEWRGIDPAHRPHVACAYEKLPIAGVVIVPFDSATRFCDEAATPVEANHIDIVKPATADDDSYIALSNAVMSFVPIGSLETPDFSLQGANAVFVISDPKGESQIHIGNGGPGKLEYSLDQFPADGLFVFPGTSGLVDETKAAVLSFAIQYGAVQSEYKFVLDTSAGPPLPVTVRVQNVTTMQAYQERLAQQLSQALLRSYGSGANANDPNFLATAAHTVIQNNYTGVTPAAQWLLTAGLLRAVNWPQQSVYALMQATQLDQSLRTNRSVEALAVETGYLAGNAKAFPGVTFDQVSPSSSVGAALFDARSNLLASPANLTLATRVADRLLQSPSTSCAAQSLKGDLLSARGQFRTAIAAYSTCTIAEQNPSLSLRVAGAQLKLANGPAAVATAEANQLRYPGPLSQQVTLKIRTLAQTLH